MTETLEIASEDLAYKYAPEDDLPIAPVREDGYQALNFLNPLELMAFYDPSIQSGDTVPHNWQIEVSEDIASCRPTSKDPLKYWLCACNGSGKDAFIVCPTVVWFALTRIRSTTVITSSSGIQLTAQTENYIRTLCERVNTFHGEEIFRIKQRFIRCRLTGSEIRLFATDEAGKAEGYHPLDPGAEMMIVTNESKSISDDIFQALTRCTGYNYWITVSTPGEPRGYFHKAVTSEEFRARTGKAVWKGRRVTAFDCPHLGEAYIEDAKITWGEHSALYRSMILALFTSLDGSVVISNEMIVKWRRNSAGMEHKFTTWPLRIGIDLAAGGDETVIAAWRGNKRVYQYAFYQEDSTITADILDQELQKLGISKDHEFIWADDGGIGKAIIDMLVQHKGWRNINRQNNQSPAQDKKRFANRGAEKWQQFARLVEECVIIPPPESEDKKFYDQLVNRHYKQSTSGKIGLLSKVDERADGHPSPDRADANILAFSDLNIHNFLDAAVENIRPKVQYSTKEELEDALLALDMQERSSGKGKFTKPINNSMSVAIQQIYGISNSTRNN